MFPTIVTLPVTCAMLSLITVQGQVTRVVRTITVGADSANFPATTIESGQVRVDTAKYRYPGDPVTPYMKRTSLNQYQSHHRRRRSGSGSVSSDNQHPKSQFCLGVRRGTFKFEKAGRVEIS